MRNEDPAVASGAPVDGNSRRRRIPWAGVIVPVLIELVISVPTLAIEETWHGRPMIDQRSALWIVPACLVAVAFLVGGALAGYGQRSATAGAERATLAASLAAAVLLAADVIRRLLLAHENVPSAVARLWYLGAGAALVISAVGSQLGRLIALRARYR
jgi:hypothetical protein